MKFKFLFVTIVLFIITFTAIGYAQDEFFPASLSHFRFNFINPGARATAMGGAFIAQGNDATGSETNPAGLLFIPKPMAFVEYRYIRYTADRAYTANDTVIINRNFHDSVNSPTFLSFVYPTKNWAVAIYRQELANFLANYANKDFIVPNTGHQNYIMNRQSIHLNFKLTNYGFSIARKLHETFAVGFSVRLAHMDFQAHEKVNLDREREKPAFFPDVLVNTNPPDVIGNYLFLDDEDWKVSYVVGFQFKPNDYFSMGGVYRYGAKHELKAVFFDNLVLPGTGSLKKEYPNFKINVPDRLGFGVSITPNDKLAFNIDVVRMFYEDLNDQFLSVLDPSVRKFFGWENGTEIRAGGEYTIPIGTENSFSLRAGYYAAPDPSIHYLGGADQTPGSIGVDFPILYPAVKTDHHATFGVGVVVHHLTVDLAGDLGRDKDYFAMSVMYNF